MDFRFSLEKNVGVFSLDGTLIGEHDGMPLADALNEKMEAEGLSLFILDLSALKHINSTGIGVFITLLTRVRKKNGDLFLVNPSQNIRNLLLITKLNSIFKIFDSIQDALRVMDANTSNHGS